MIEKFLSYIQEKIKKPGIQRQFKNMGWMFFAKIGSFFISFLATAYIARNLGPTNYGELSYAISFAALFSFIASLGIDQILYRELIENPEKRNELLGSAILLRIIASLLAAIITMFFVISFSPKDVSLFLVFIICLSPLFGSFQLLSYEFQANIQAKKTSILVLGVVILLNILKIITVFLGGGVIYLAGIILLEPILYSIGYIYLKQKTYNDILLLKYNKNTILSIFNDAFPLIFASAFYVIYARIDQVMLKNMISAEAVGLYDAAVRVAEFSYFIPQILLTSLLPTILLSKKNSLTLYTERSRKLFIFLISITFFIALSTSLFSEKILMIIFGNSFESSGVILNIYIWSNIGASLNLLSQQILVSENKTKFISLTTFLGMVSNILLNLLLIPKYGTSGAAYATLVSYCVPFASVFLFKETRSIMLQFLVKSR